jgi:hypothetical protein
VGNEFQLPFTYQIGDVISGKLTFEPNVGTPTGDNTIKADQFHELQFDINGTVFGTSRYSVQVLDNDLVIADDLDTSNGVVVDTMILECATSSSQSCIPDPITVPGGDPFSINARLALTGDNSILDMPTISEDPAVWNLFNFRRWLNLSFGNETGGSMTMLATVHEFSTAPEPSNLSVTIGMFIWSFAASRLRQKQKRRGMS